MDACSADKIDEEGVIRWDQGNNTHSIDHSPHGEFFCTDGLCTHEKIHLWDALAMSYVIERPKHDGQFASCTDEAGPAPVGTAPKTCPVRVEAGDLQVRVG